MHGPFAAIDFETATPDRTSACAVGVCVIGEAGQITRAVVRLIKPPQGKVAPANYRIHGIGWAQLEGEPDFAEVWHETLPYLHGAGFIAAHNVAFDRSVLEKCCEMSGFVPPDLPWVCTVQLSRKQWGPDAGHSLPDVCDRLNIAFDKHHDAGADAEACARVLLALRGDPPPPLQPNLFDTRGDLVTLMRVPTDNWRVPDAARVGPRVKYRREELFAYSRYIGVSVVTPGGTMSHRGQADFCNCLHHATAASVDGGPWRPIENEVTA